MASRNRSCESESDTVDPELCEIEVKEVNHFSRVQFYFLDGQSCATFKCTFRKIHVEFVFTSKPDNWNKQIANKIIWFVNKFVFSTQIHLAFFVYGHAWWPVSYNRICSTYIAPNYYVLTQPCVPWIARNKFFLGRRSNQKQSTESKGIKRKT